MTRDLLHGPCRFYYSDGTLAVESFFDNGKREGKACYYSKEGLLVKESNYKQGLLDGVQKYFQNGILASEFEMKEGKFDGKILLYHPDGTVRREVNMKEGKRHGIDSLWDVYEGILFAFEYSEGAFVKAHIEDLVAKQYKL